jgi:FkbM family methyltransferase
MHSIFGKLVQLSNLRWSRWWIFIRAWLRRRQSGSVPCVFPASRQLVQVPLDEFYDSYRFFCESGSGRAEIGFFLNRLRPRDVVFDIGAFRGAYGAAAKSMLGDAVKVHLFEPLPGNLAKLRTISALNHFQDFEIVGKAVGSGSAIKGTVDRTDAMLRSGDGGNAAGSVEFPSTSVDAYVAETGVIPSLMKIDIEGFESDLIQGASRCLAAHKPRLWIEMHPELLSAGGKRWQDLIEHLKSLGYATTFFRDYDLPTRDKVFHVWCEP